MGQCKYCGAKSPLISEFLGLCPRCIRYHFDQVLPLIEEAHFKARAPFYLPPKPPQEGGISCRICQNECLIAEGEKGYCGVYQNVGGKIVGATANLAKFSWYYDPLPTNCVASWVCPAGTEEGYPQFSHCPGPEYGYRNLAVFYQACSFNCLFCQNWQFKKEGNWESAEFLASKVGQNVSCICFFGGDPTPQLPHAIRVSRLIAERNKAEIVRICWETNGSMHPRLLKQMALLSLNSGGCVKFDLKAWDERLHLALCGVSNRRTLENFEYLSIHIKKRPSPPFLVASTLLVPGYVDREEVSRVAAFISSLDPDIPYSLLAFYPQFMMKDLPPTSKQHAEECLREAKAQGLKKVRLGNIHLLGDDY
jgi:pyruvate formate lyase activating enzyme